MSTPPAARRLTVDGEVFEVRPSEHQQGFDFRWITGPNPGYGFSSGVTAAATRADQPPGGRSASDDQAGDQADDEAGDEALVAQIRWFLGLIDHETGYIGSAAASNSR